MSLESPSGVSELHRSANHQFQMTTTQSVQPPTIPSAPKTPGLAIASLVLGIVSVLGAAILIIPTVLAIIFGHVAYSRIRKNPSLGGSGIAIAGFVLGYVSIVFGIFTAGLLAAMAIPAFQKVRENSIHMAMRNDARQIAAAAQQLMIEEGEKPISFQIDPTTGSVTGPISAFVRNVTKGTQEVDGVIENSQDDFSLRNPDYRNGVAVAFDAEGREK